jgi:uncharacterized protein YndB with AHSA1/START domain
MSDTRKTEHDILVPATLDEVWRALTEARELTRWFPTEATIEPHAGGRFQMSWDGAWEWSGRVEIWEPGRHLRVVLSREHTHTADGKVAGPAETGGHTILDYQLESDNGQTRVRLVHSGFGRGGSWDDEYEGVSRGWPYELKNLRFYFLRHRGHDRSLVWAVVTSPAAREHAWQRLFAAGALVGTPGLLDSRVGDPFAVTLPTGEHVEGVVYHHTPGFDLSARIPSLGDGTLRISVEPQGGQVAVSLWFATWGDHRGAASRFRDAAQEMLQGLFAA